MMKRPHAICRGMRTQRSLADSAKDRRTRCREPSRCTRPLHQQSVVSPRTGDVSTGAELKPGLDGMGKECLCWVGSVGPNGDSPPECGSLA